MSGVPSNCMMSTLIKCSMICLLVASDPALSQKTAPDTGSASPPPVILAQRTQAVTAPPKVTPQTAPNAPDRALNLAPPEARFATQLAPLIPEIKEAQRLAESGKYARMPGP